LAASSSWSSWRMKYPRARNVPQPPVLRLVPPGGEAEAHHFPFGSPFGPLGSMASGRQRNFAPAECNWRGPWNSGLLPLWRRREPRSFSAFSHSADDGCSETTSHNVDDGKLISRHSTHAPSAEAAVGKARTQKRASGMRIVGHPLAASLPASAGLIGTGRILAPSPFDGWEDSLMSVDVVRGVLGWCAIINQIRRADLVVPDIPARPRLDLSSPRSRP
jgi:hypothetical protein